MLESSIHCFFSVSMFSTFSGRCWSHKVIAIVLRGHNCICFSASLMSYNPCAIHFLKGLRARCSHIGIWINSYLLFHLFRGLFFFQAHFVIFYFPAIQSTINKTRSMETHDNEQFRCDFCPLFFLIAIYLLMIGKQNEFLRLTYLPLSKGFDQWSRFTQIRRMMN